MKIKLTLLLFGFGLLMGTLTVLVKLKTILIFGQSSNNHGALISVNLLFIFPILIFIVNDSEITLADSLASATSQGGTSAFLSGFVNYLMQANIPFATIGTFRIIGGRKNHLNINSGSNATFLLKLAISLLRKKFRKNDCLYFQRPDHLATALFTRARCVLHLHGKPVATIKERSGAVVRIIYHFLELLAFRKAYAVIATDLQTADLYKALYPAHSEKISVIPTGVNCVFFSQKNSFGDTTKRGKENVLIYSGRLAYPKRLADILFSFSLALKLQSNLSLLITGDGPLKKEIDQIINSLGIQSNVVLTGYVDKVKLRSLIQMSDAGILLSHHEGSPVSVKEILACGKPVIVNMAGDLCDYIFENKTGYIVSPDNHQQVAKAIIKAVNNSKTMANDCISAISVYDENIINQAILQILLKEDEKSKKRFKN